MLDNLLLKDQIISTNPLLKLLSNTKNIIRSSNNNNNILNSISIKLQVQVHLVDKQVAYLVSIKFAQLI